MRAVRFCFKVQDFQLRYVSYITLRSRKHGDVKIIFCIALTWIERGPRNLGEDGLRIILRSITY